MFPNKVLMEKCYLLWAKLFLRDCFLERKNKCEAEKVFKQYESCCENNGGVLFAVCRGKFSEGQDFK